jgi:PAS domain S-box-containing protein
MMHDNYSQILIDAIPQQVWVTNDTGEMIDINSKVSGDFGLEKAEVLQKGWTAFIHPEDLERSMILWEACLTSGKAYVNEFRLLFADGSYHWHLARATQINEPGKAIFWVGTNTNIAVQKRNELVKEEFISVASHELKTPVTAIKGYNQLLLRSTTNPTYLAYVNKSLAQLNRLEKLVGDLLDVSKINAGKMVLNPESFDFSELMQATIANLQELYSSHQIIVAQNAKVNIIGDRYRLEQVLQNFISNAVKYSPNENKIEVNAVVEMGFLVISVHDFGVGIKREEIGKLFNRYYRTDNTSTRFEGLGIGLYIAADIIKRHGGSFWIESELGTGSSFYFKLPLAPFKVDVVEQRADYYQDKYITISCNQKEQLMQVDWRGHQDEKSVKHGGKLMIEYLRNNQCSKVFNDNRKVLGTWSEASDWAATVWLPQMENAGLRNFAWIFSESIFSQLSALKSVENENKSANIRFFANAAEAMDWLTQAIH